MSKICFLNSFLNIYWTGQLVERLTRSSLEREVWGSNLGPVKSDTELPTVRHRCDISSKGAVLPGHNDAEMGPARLHASAYYNEYNERFDLIWFEHLLKSKKKTGTLG